jgi:hypothetical protein
MKLYILSSRGFTRSPAQACINEFEDELVLLCAGTLLCPDSQSKRRSTVEIIKSALLPAHHDSLPLPLKENASEGAMLLIPCLSIWDASLLWDIPEWRKIFDKVCLYIFDSMELPDLANRSLKRFRKLVDSVDFIFVSMKGSLERYQQQLMAPVDFVPLGASVRRFGSSRLTRSVDMMAYGRQQTRHVELLEAAFNDPSSERLFYYTSHLAIKELHDSYGHRRLFWKLLAHSKIALAYDGMAVNPDKRFSFSFVGQRWFESAAAGCAIVGRRPTCPEMSELFDWEDATIEVPEDERDLLPFVEQLLMDSARLNSIHARNHAHSLARHDWSHRICQIFDAMDLPKPASLLTASQDCLQKITGAEGSCQG